MEGRTTSGERSTKRGKCLSDVTKKRDQSGPLRSFKKMLKPNGKAETIITGVLKSDPPTLRYFVLAK